MSKVSPALVISVIALFVALGGAGMAATGGNFILGKANSATSTTSLSAPIGGRALQVSNTSTAAGATALGLTAAAGHAPLTVNTKVKVANLNADTLDGMDSSGFVRGDNFGTNTGGAQQANGTQCTLAQIRLTASTSLTAGGVPANGQILAINQNQALFMLLGTTYGGNGQTTFALPDLRALTPNHMTYSICVAGVFPSGY
jgi:Phage Tail Collar Domain